MEGPHIWRADCKYRVSTVWRFGAPNPCVVQGSTAIYFLYINTKFLNFQYFIKVLDL